MPLGKRVPPTSPSEPNCNQPPTAQIKPTRQTPLVFQSIEPVYTFEDIILNHETYNAIQNVLTIFSKRDLIFEEWGLGRIFKQQNKAGINLYGTPGTGKTMAAHAIANQLTRRLLPVDYSEIESRYVGDTAKNLVTMFEYAKSEKAVIFFDEADALLSKRVTDMSHSTDVSVNQTRSTLLLLISDYDDIILFATNFISNYDPAFMRRILGHIKFELPDEENRVKLWKKYIPPSLPTDIDKAILTKKLAGKFDNVSGSDISNAVLQSALKAARQNELFVKCEYFEEAIKNTLSSKYDNSETEDGVAAASEEHLRDVETNFNLEANKISPILGDFDSFLIQRINYCFNFDVKELGLNCTPEQLMTLIKRSNIPAHFEEWQEYDDVSHRMKTNKNSLYLKNNSVTVNCYRKHYQLAKSFPDCPDIDNSLNVIRFEIQCKYLKVYNMSRNIKNNMEYRNIEILKAMTSDGVCWDIVMKYFDKVIRKGWYYPLETAKKLVQARQFRYKKEERLINTLNMNNRCRGISKAKAELKGERLDEFKRSVRELEEININPVTIPKEWNIKFIPNLFFAYDNKICREEYEKSANALIL